MELIYPFVIYIGVPLLIILSIVSLKKKVDFKSGKKIANTRYLTDTPYYKEIMKKYKIISNVIKALCIFSVLMSLILLARPAVLNSSLSSNYNRDIILCMDVSDSVNELNESLVENLKEVVKGLKGERFGISIFNTSSVLLVPLTDDYNYVLETLDTLQNNLKLRNDFLKSGSYFASDDVFLASQYLHSGTLVGNENRGSSIIGDGLASCVYNFGNLEEERTRIIIFSTDNELLGEEVVELKEAGMICKENNITVFGIAPRTITQENKLKFQEVTSLTEGEYYTEGITSVSDIVNNISQKGKSLMQGKTELKLVDNPFFPFILLIISLMGLFVLSKKVKL